MILCIFLSIGPVHGTLPRCGQKCFYQRGKNVFEERLFLVQSRLPVNIPNACPSIFLATIHVNNFTLGRCIAEDTRKCCVECRVVLENAASSSDTGGPAISPVADTHVLNGHFTTYTQLYYFYKWKKENTSYQNRDLFIYLVVWIHFRHHTLFQKVKGEHLKYIKLMCHLCFDWPISSDDML